MAKREQWWVSKKDQTLAGRKVWVGQLIQPTGAINDDKIFAEQSYWASRTDLQEAQAEPCGTDGCDAVFANLGYLDRHRKLVHGPEREYQLRRREEERRYAAESEERGDTIGGYPVEQVKSGPGGPVPYVSPAPGR